MSGCTVSVLIPAYNAAEYIERALESVLSQSWPLLEIIVVDDGSTDDTLLIAKRFEKESVIVVTQRNQGASAARNRAFLLATGSYIQYLDADDLLHPDKIKLQIEPLLPLDASIISSSSWATFVNSPTESTFVPTPVWKDYLDPADWLIDAWRYGVWMQPSAWLTHRKLIEGAGPWNESLSLHDDGEFFCRVLLCSTGIRFCGGAKSYYRKGLSESLSSLRSPGAALSHLSVCRLYESHLLERRNDHVSRRVCAGNFQRFIYENYPMHPELLKVAATHIDALGGSDVRPVSTPLFKLVDNLLGWKVSKVLQNYIYRHGLNPSAWRKYSK